MSTIDDNDLDFTDITLPAQAAAMPTAAATESGPAVEPLKRLYLYTDDEWEFFIEEWAHECLKKQYKTVKKQSGANDKGIDIAGFKDDKLLLGVWDNYQCKHYDHAIMPSEAWVEIGKILWYSFCGDYNPPRAYYFVAPKETGTTLSQYLANAPLLKSKLIEAWDKNCLNEITETQAVQLTGAFAEYVDKFDFSIFKTQSIRKLLDDYKKTPHYVKRFGGGFPARPKPESPPDEIASSESVYVARLLEAYSDHTKETIKDSTALKPLPKLEQHFKRQREAFYHAESLRVFVRDKVEPGTFESLQQEIYDGVVDTCDADHADGYERVVAVAKTAQEIQIDAHPLSRSTFVKDKHGICHQLANEDRLKWTK